MKLATTELVSADHRDESLSGRRGYLGTLARLRSEFTRSGRKLFHRLLPSLDRQLMGSTPPGAHSAADLARALLSVRGEASSVAIAADLLALYAQFDMAERETFLVALAREFDPDEAALTSVWERYRRDGAPALPALASAVEAPRQELFRRLNFAPGGTAALVRLREDLLSLKRGNRELERVDEDLRHLLASWFNRGFLTMQTIDWSSPASLLARLIKYESVHDINSWGELRLRVEPEDRRCFAFFHPVIPDEPLIFVEVALTHGVPDNVQELLADGRPPINAQTATTATFYSINNCQPGLTGISFGHFLIKQVAADLKRELPNLQCFVTLSPVPALMNWLRKSELTDEDRALVAKLDNRDGLVDVDEEAARKFLLTRAVDYFTSARNAAGKPYDPVARFHLGNGARLEQLNWRADMSANGLRQSGGLMVNYLYELAHLEENHEAFVERGTVVTGAPFDKLAASLAAHGTSKGL